ncbi:Uncharacterised protein [Escherichia coli]|nr:Uncharacterised protein [Escherichia coli]
MMRPGNSAPSVSVGVASTNEAVMAVSCDICSTTQRSLSSCSGSASGLPATKFTASRKRAYTRRRTTVAPTRLCKSSAIPVTSPNRFDTVSDGRALLPFPFISKPLPSIGYAWYFRPCQVTGSPFSFSSLQKKYRSPPCTVRSISQSTTRGDCSDLTDSFRLSS